MVNGKKADGVNNQNNNWFYSEKVKEHFFSPKNVAINDKIISDMKPNGVGEVGSPACGDMMHFWIKVDDNTKKIIDCKWRTFGCASAIASTSILSEMLIKDKMHIDKAYNLTSKDVYEKLGGLPQLKVHCSVLGTQALKKAIDDYKSK